MLDKGIKDIVAMCGHFYVSNKKARKIDYIENTLFLSLQQILSDAFSGIAMLQASLFPGWKADAQHPGYLIKIESPHVLRAPFHLVPIFPSETVLNDVWHISRIVKTNEGSVICISGSTTSIKVTKVINDIDFCEYIPLKKPKTISEISEKTNSIPNRVFRRLQFHKKSWGQPLDVRDMQEHLGYADATRQEVSSGKIDYIVNVGTFRPCDVSNVMIFCNEQWESAAHDRSFPAQEALLEASLAIPNQMCDPFELGRYVYWLQERVKGYIEEGHHLKAIKRALSLTRIYFLPELTDRIKDFLSLNEAVYQQELQEIDKLIADLALFGDGYASWIADLTKVKVERIEERSRVSNNTQIGAASIESFAAELQGHLPPFSNYQPIAA